MDHCIRWTKAIAADRLSKATSARNKAGGGALENRARSAPPALQNVDKPLTETFRHNPELSRYELEVDGLLAFADYQRSGHRLVIPHVEADPALRGQGAAGRLMAKVAELARAEDRKIVPICSYAAAWLKRNDPGLVG